jgi:hypothetical protein
LAVSARIFVESPIMWVVSPGAIFIESAILIESARVLSAALLFCAFLHAPAAMTTTATAKAMRFMLAPVEVRVGKTAKRT